jgi:hypothetical protein
MPDIALPDAAIISLIHARNEAVGLGIRATEIRATELAAEAGQLADKLDAILGHLPDEPPGRHLRVVRDDDTA